MKEKILLTGGSGFVGQNIINNLRSEDRYEIFNLSKHPLSDKSKNNFIVDAEDFDFSSLADQQFDYVIHSLALSNDSYCTDFFKAQRINVDFTGRLLEFCLKQKKLKKVIYISSIIIYDRFNTPPVKEDGKLYLNYTNYTFTKGIAEYYVDFYRQRFNLPVIIFRLSNIYGPYQSFINSPFLVPSKIHDALTKKDFEIFSLKPRRDWIYSDDAAKAIVMALDSDYNGLLNLASGEGVTVEEVARQIANCTGAAYHSLDKETSGPTDFYCDISKIKTVLNWRPRVNLREGIFQTVNYIKERLV